MAPETLVRWIVPDAPPRAPAALRAAPLPLLRGGLAMLGQLPARSGLRRRLLTQLVIHGFDLLNRREIDQVLRFYDPSCEIRLGPGWPLDLERTWHGHAGGRAILSAWDEIGAVSFVAEQVLDMGGPAFVVLASVHVTGAASGLNPRPIQAVWSYVTRRGLIAQQALRNDGWGSGPEELVDAVRRAGSSLAPP